MFGSALKERGREFPVLARRSQLVSALGSAVGAASGPASGPSRGPSLRAGRLFGSESGRHRSRRSSFAATRALRPAKAELEVAEVPACASPRGALSPVFLTPGVPAPLRCSLNNRAVSQLPGMRPCRSRWRFSRPVRLRRPVQGRPSFWGAALAVQPHRKHAQMPGPTSC